MNILPNVIHAALATAIIPATLVAQQADGRQSEIYRNSVQQAALAKDVSTLRSELATLRQQMGELLPEDAATLDGVAARLGTLAETDLEAATNELRGAGTATDSSEQTAKITEAIQSQAAVSSTLDQLAIELNARQSIAEMDDKLSDILLRQASVWNETERLARTAAGPADIRENKSIRHEWSDRFPAIRTEQEILGDQIATALKAYRALGNQLPEPSGPAITASAPPAMDAAIAAQTSQAAKLAGSGPFQQALPVQSDIVASISQLLGAVRETAGAEARLNRLIETLDRVSESQEKVSESMTSENGQLDNSLVSMQRRLSDETTALGAQVRLLNVAAASELGTAHQAMEEAIVLPSDGRPVAITSAREALARAKAKLEKQLTAAVEAPTTKEELTELLKELASEADALAQEQRSALTDSLRGKAPDPAAQEARLERTEELQAKAALVQPEASDQLGDAAEALQAGGPAGEQEAAKDLTEAANSLKQELAAAEGNTPEQQALARAEALTEAAGDKAEAGAENLNDENSAQAVNQFKEAQAQVAAAQQAASDAPAEAQEALAEAAEALGKAQLDSAQVKLSEAGAAADAAKAALEKASEALGEAQAAASGQAAKSLAKAQNTAAKSTDPNGESTQGGGGEAGGDFIGDDSSDGPPVAEGSALATGLSTKDREAIKQLEMEKPPRESAAAVQQYFKNLADGTGI